MDKTSKLFRKLYPPSLVAAALLSVGCNPADNNGDDSQVSAEIPPSLLSYSFKGELLSAQLSVDEKNSIDMEIDINNRKLSGDLDISSNGEHAFHISFYLLSDGETVEIANSSVITTLADTGVTKLDFTQYTYLDYDLDGFTNLVEIARGVNWNDWTEKPTTLALRRSPNYEMNGDIYDGPTILKVELSGISYSSNYANKSLL